MESVNLFSASTVFGQDRSEKFKLGIREISRSAEELLAGLRQHGATHAQLGIQLAGLLKLLRQQRSYSMDLAMGKVLSAQFDTYIGALGNLRSTVANWLTLLAVNPHSIEVEATDFEMQCFSTLGAGLVWQESLNAEGRHDHLMPDTQTMALMLGLEKAHGEDITEQVQHDWNQLNPLSEAAA